MALQRLYVMLPDSVADVRKMAREWVKKQQEREEARTQELLVY